MIHFIFGEVFFYNILGDELINNNKSRRIKYSD